MADNLCLHPLKLRFQHFFIYLFRMPVCNKNFIKARNMLLIVRMTMFVLCIVIYKFPFLNQ